MRRLLGWLIGVYLRSPFHPWLGRFLASTLARAIKFKRGGLFAHPVGADFRMWIDLEQRIDAKVYFTGAWEPQTLATIEALVPQGGVAVDIGANIGYLSLVLASRVGPGGRVLAFEPVRWTFERLQANEALNQMPQLTTVHAGLSDRVERLEPLDLPYGYRLDGRVQTQRQQLELTTLDSYLAQHPVPRLDFIKCDTDGFEERALRGAEQTLRRFKPAIHFELHQGQAADDAVRAERLLRWLQSLGYRFAHEGRELLPMADVDDVMRQLPAHRFACNVVALPAA